MKNKMKNLPFLCKHLEKCVIMKLQNFLEENSISVKFESGVKRCHGTETAF